MRLLLFFICIGLCSLSSNIRAQFSIGFNGLDSYVQISDENSLRLQQFTIECWIQINGNGIAIQTGTEGVNAIPIITKGTEDAESVSGINYFLGIRASDHVLVFDYELSASAEIPFLNQAITGVTPLKSNIWYHIAVSYNGNSVSIFLNGKLESRFETFGNPFINDESDLGIATAFDKNNNPIGRFNGIIDALRVWNIPLTQEQLLQNINAEISNLTPGLVIALNFNEGVGTITNPVGEFLPIDVTLTNTSWQPEAPFMAMIPPIVEEEKIMSIGLISDPQYCDCPEGTLRKYRLSLEKLSVAIDTINSRNVDFTVTLGDVIDRHYISYDSILPLYNTVNNPKYFLLGNHEFDSVENSLKDEIPGRLNMPDYYYDIEYNNWKFLFLDGTEMAEYTTVLHPELAEEADSMRERVTGWVNDHVWNGGFSRTQLSWIEQHLANSLENHQNVVLFCHWPVFPFNTRKNLWNDTAVVSLIEKFPNVVAYIDGHNHAGNYGIRNGIHYVNQVAMVETAEYNSFQTLDIYPDKLVFDGFGLNKDKTLSIRDNFKIIPSPTLSDNTLYYSHNQGSYIGRFNGKSSNTGIYLIGDTALYDNNYFMLSGDSLFLKSVPDYNQQTDFKIKLGLIDNVFDTVSVNYTLELNPIVFIRKKNFADTLISIYDDYIVPFKSFVSDYSLNGLRYELDISDEAILSGGISDTSITLSPITHGNSQVIIHVIDPYTTESYADTLIVSVFDPQNSSPTHFDIRKILIPTEDTLNILLDTLFFDADNDPLFYEIETYSNPKIHLIQPEKNLLQIWSESTIDTLVSINCSDNRGGYDTLQLPFLFNSPPTVLQPIPDNLIQLGGQELNISLTSRFEDTDVDSLSYSYSVNNEEIAVLTILSDELIIDPQSNGDLIICLIASDSYGSTAEIPFHVRINAPPIPVHNDPEIFLSEKESFHIMLDTLFSDQDNDSLSYKFFIVNQEICDIDLYPGYIELRAVKDGETHLSITVSDGFGAFALLTIKIIVGNPLSDETGLDETDEFLIFPNPSNDLIKIHFSALPNKNYRLLLFDHLGRTKGELDYSSSENSVQQVNLSIPYLSPGIYFLHILDEKKILHSDKIIIL